MRCIGHSLLVTLWLTAHALAAPTSQPIDVLDYFLQKSDTNGSWTLGGTDVREDSDPEGTDSRTIILNKFSSPSCYEVYKVTPDELQIRYEVMRANPTTGDGNWIRRYQELGDRHGKLPGHVWMPRRVVPDGKVFLTRHAKDRWVFDIASRSYVIDSDGSSADETIAFSFELVTTDWGDRNHTGVQLNPALRLISQWQREGKIFETYDYSKGAGLTRWRWLERVATLPHVEGDVRGKIFRCEEGAVMVEDAGDQNFYPLVHRYDLGHRTKGEALATIRFKSHWASELGEQWYVDYRDTLREGPLVKKNEKIAHDFTLPEWKDKPGATIKDLPALFTHSPP